MRFIINLIIVTFLVFPFGVSAQVSIRVEPLNNILVDLERRAPADVQSLNNSLLSAEVMAVVAGIHADVGHQVEAGTLLVELENTDYLLALEQAEANLVSAVAQKEQADSKLRRARELLGNQYLSADELLDRETDVTIRQSQIKSAEVAIRVARRNLEKCRIIAPFKGVVTARTAQVGSFVGIGTVLVQLVQTDRYELNAELPSGVADSLPDAGEIWFESRNQRFPVELLRLSPVIESERRSRHARFGFSGEAPAVGRSGDVVWHIESGQLPTGLVSRRNGVLGVFLNDNGKARFSPLPGAQEGRPVPVNLPPGTEIITVGRERLQDGDTLSVSR